MFDCGIEQFSFLIRSVGLNNSANFVNFAVNLTNVNEVGKFFVDEFGTDTECLCHVLNGHTFKRLKILSIGNQSHLLSEILGMLSQVLIFFNLTDDLNEAYHELFVITIVE